MSDVDDRSNAIKKNEKIIDVQLSESDILLLKRIIMNNLYSYDVTSDVANEIYVLCEKLGLSLKSILDDMCIEEEMKEHYQGGYVS